MVKKEGRNNKGQPGMQGVNQEALAVSPKVLTMRKVELARAVKRTCPAGRIPRYPAAPAPSYSSVPIERNLCKISSSGSFRSVRMLR